jgi:hypothetical protein
MNSRYVPAIEKPCPMKWDDMKGDEKRRYCEHCHLHVHNLSAMTPQEQRETLSPGPDRRCISYVAPPAAVPVNVAKWESLQSPLWWRRRAAAVLLAISAVFMNSCRMTGKIAPPDGGHACPPDKAGHGKRMLGEFMPRDSRTVARPAPKSE